MANFKTCKMQLSKTLLMTSATALLDRLYGAITLKASSQAFGSRGFDIGCQNFKAVFGVLNRICIRCLKEITP